jgi:LmbE family N-acetylglucosaminyl deacetylase
LSLTRGDGGQNLIGDEQGIELGLIRTQELLAARRIDGAEQFFTRAYDFGFCKSSAEAMQTWGHDKILSDVVWVIRKFKPDVIITRFPGDSRAGHGQHSASALLAAEAFDAAADPERFPEQLSRGVEVWQAKRHTLEHLQFWQHQYTKRGPVQNRRWGIQPFAGEKAMARSRH